MARHVSAQLHQCNAHPEIFSSRSFRSLRPDEFRTLFLNLSALRSIRHHYREVEDGGRLWRERVHENIENQTEVVSTSLSNTVACGIDSRTRKLTCSFSDMNDSFQKGRNMKEWWLFILNLSIISYHFTLPWCGCERYSDESDELQEQHCIHRRNTQRDGTCDLCVLVRLWEFSCFRIYHSFRILFKLDWC